MNPPRSQRAADFALAAALLSVGETPSLTAPPAEGHLLCQSFTAAREHVVELAPDNPAPLRPYAAAGLKRDVKHVVIGTSPLERAVNPVCSVSSCSDSGDDLTDV
ncbi:hypothetical protein BWQ96_10697 [Gracilariopsis chorda]|uniref:Uncharacterized protein n=1 Tax=Gracilariopsis chorda TaxID=448386 RepID=A0A2V3IBY6_9FLOR|nr:hypothetical protein BWQ96_10697 [Gracilariopsis chorda]|eukprot:PXF39609.1 hypothetical protein BWQ96_10697 [Gracilariopsis chorda]